MKFFLKALLLLSFTLTQASCSLLAVQEQSERLTNVAYISGTLDNINRELPTYAVLLKKNAANIEIAAQVLLDENNYYQFNLVPGSYIVGAYIDTNKNAKRDKNELYGLYNQGQGPYHIITMGIGEEHHLSSFAINRVLSLDQEKNSKINLSKSITNIGKIASLDSDLFTKENASLGLWQPLTFIEKLGGGLFMLQAFEQGKTPVIFVHGALGSPTEFTQMINALDDTKYQPWVLYYPSGLQLNLVSDYLLNSLSQLQKQYEFSDINLVAHSMGGLMTRSFLMKHQKKSPDYNVSLYMTINSPLYGMASASSGVKSSPIVIPSWRDLAVDSDYIKRVHNWQLPKSIDYHLIFSYLPGEEGDGVVPMSSQLSLELQEEASQIYGFQAQHTGVLQDKRFIQLFSKVLSSQP